MITIEEFLAPKRAMPAACLGCGADVIFEEYFGLWSHVSATFCPKANSAAYYAPRRRA